jgi:hypothetical protein
MGDLPEADFGPASLRVHPGHDYTKPDQTSTGVDYVIVNGQLEYHGGKLIGIMAGRALRGCGYQLSAH